MTKEKPLEVVVQLSLDSTKYTSKGEILFFSPNQNNIEFGYFFSDSNKNKVVLFVSGADK